MRVAQRVALLFLFVLRDYVEERRRGIRVTRSAAVQKLLSNRHGTAIGFQRERSRILLYRHGAFA
jgi:hypothetical protein